MLKENKRVPKLIIKQQKGDVLFIPPWWIHETVVRKLKKNLGFNIHFGLRGQILFEIVNIAHSLFGDTTFFYGQVKAIETELPNY